mmetsp:Transcript_24282/g.35989  ORF Transcript_24282/g.35989 Transcript_24282/m.35989 type:complete len:410 (-) Transcript_24282:155-1384(-)|eukprot:CAMPEP_0194201206 /NCGR_PEP_ID=MMETSP0156-20130528/1534_1 /TAXON_ID=33649 /ORGANISM="Thalassionema nitzschioides, Strain L26-B" /LENGTH=409 /DNA_ID=CAMNT_0038926337 /DNA_START=16 /DNA_END=1245 /DNA_ORIENTATION=+
MKQIKRTLLLLCMLLLLNVVVASTTAEDDGKTGLRQQELRGLKDPKTVEQKELPKKDVIIVLDPTYGLCQQLVNMLCQIIYIRDKGGDFMVDESTYGYRWNRARGPLSLFFKPALPLITNEKSYSKMGKEFGISDYKSARQVDSYFDGFTTENTTSPIFITASNGQTRMPCCNPAFQEPKHQLSDNKQAMALYELNLMEKAYKRMSDEACKSLQINDWAIKRQIQPLKDEHHIPNFREEGLTTVAFHVRRGDGRLKADAKLYPGEQDDEVRAYPGYLYVDKLLDITLDPIDHCFIATDDYAAVEEVTAALNHRNVNCTVHTMMSNDNPNKQSVVVNDGRPLSTATTGPGAAHFLAELSMLMDATYFIGTFAHSHVATYVALQRKCVHTTNTVHYANSYGVDRDDWSLMY